MYLQLNTRFNPFTYDEMVKPLIYYKEAYDKAEAAYDTLAQQTEMWRNIANREKSPEAFAMFQRYSNDLANASSSFSQGMTSQNRRALVGLKRRYASDIQPIATAYARQTALADEQRKAELANPTMLWERRASDMSLDDFIKNPNADYGRSISGAALSAQVAAGASALAKEFRDDPKRMEQLVGGDFFEYVKKRGFSSKAVLAAIMNSKDASPILTNLVETAIDATGIKGWADEATLNQAYNYARQGLWNAVGQDEAQLVQNWRAQENLEHSHAMSRQAAAYQMELEKAYLTQTAQPYVKADGSVGYYQPITKNSNGTYSRTPVPDDAIKGNPKADSKVSSNSGSGISRGLSDTVNLNAVDTNGNPVSQVGKLTIANKKESRLLTNSGTTAADVSNDKAVKGLKGLKEKGFRVVAVIGRHNNGLLEWGAPGTDFGDGNMIAYTDLGNGIKMPKLKNPNNSKKGYVISPSSESAFFGLTNHSNVIGKYGDYINDRTMNNIPLRYIDDFDVYRLPDYVQATISEAARGAKSGYYSVFGVEGEDGEDSYVIAESL